MQPLGSAQLFRGKNGKLNISTSRMSRGKPIGDEWLEILESDYGDYLMALSQAIELLTFFKTLPPLWERFLDALTWYGDAVAESSEAAKIIKFVSAIERMTGTGKETSPERRVTDIIVSRASILYRNISGQKLIDSIRRVEDIYDQRSNLVHGSLSPQDEVCTKDAIEAEYLTRFILLAGFDFFDYLDLADTTVTQKKLKLAYIELEKYEIDLLEISLIKNIIKCLTLMQKPEFCVLFLENYQVADDAKGNSDSNDLGE
jgi:Apea-like HEPN